MIIILRQANSTLVLSVVPIAFTFTSASTPNPYRGFQRTSNLETPQSFYAHHGH